MDLIVYGIIGIPFVGFILVHYLYYVIKDVFTSWNDHYRGNIHTPTPTPIEHPQTQLEAQFVFNFSSMCTSLHCPQPLSAAEFQQQQIKTLPKTFPQVIDTPKLGCTDVLQHEINLTEEKPKHIAPYPVSDEKHRLIDRLVSEML